MKLLISLFLFVSSCDFGKAYYINKLNSYEELIVIPNEKLSDSFTVSANTFPLFSSELKFINYISIHIKRDLLIIRNKKDSLQYKTDNLKLRINKKNHILTYSNDYYKWSSNRNDISDTTKYMYNVITNFEKNSNKIGLENEIIQLMFNFEPGLKEGDTLTLFTNGILFYENGTKILPDSINIIVPN